MVTLKLRLKQVIILLFFLSPHASHSKDADSTYTDLKKHQGYLLIKLELDEANPILFASKITKRNSQRRERTIRIDTSSADGDFLLIALSEGDYQIIRVEQPLFHYPYKISTQHDLRWRFSVKKGRVNYAGSLYASHERKVDTIYVNLRNQIAYEMKSIYSIYDDIISEYPLTSGSSYRDDFYSEFLESRNGTH